MEQPVDGSRASVGTAQFGGIAKSKFCIGIFRNRTCQIRPDIDGRALAQSNVSLQLVDIHHVNGIRDRIFATPTQSRAAQPLRKNRFINVEIADRGQIWSDLASGVSTNKKGTEMANPENRLEPNLRNMSDDRDLNSLFWLRLKEPLLQQPLHCFIFHVPPFRPGHAFRSAEDV
jgi:hypothetical protein